MTLALRHLRSDADYRACVRLQEKIWGDRFPERVPSAILKISQEMGGVSAGAFDGEERLVGFVFGVTGIRNGATVHWSDMLGVLPAVAGTGVATALKAFQRDTVLELGVDEMYWTFDPLRARNAYLNLEKLGAVVREYRPDMYGSSDSPLHRGVGTDRFLALWRLRSARVESRLAASPERGASRVGGESRAGGGSCAGVNREGPATGALATDGISVDAAVDVLTVSLDGSHPIPRDPDKGSTAPRIAVAIPSDIGAIMNDDPSLAVAWREATRQVFTHYLSHGYEARGFLRGPVVSRYVLEERPTP